jgi:death-on-curing protein
LPRLWYPERYHVQVVCHKLAGHIFATDEWPLPAFEFLNKETGPGLLDSALALPKQSFSGRYFYRTWDEKAGVLLRSLIKNHPLFDGNKRVGLATIIIFLLMNGRYLLASNEDMVQFALNIAKDENPSWRKIGRWIKERAFPIKTVRRVISRLKKRYPERIAQLDNLDAAIAGYGTWARNYRRTENEMRRRAKQEGIDPAIVLEPLAKQAL